MTRSKAFMALVAVMFIAAFAAGCGKKEQPAPAPAKPSETAAPAAPVAPQEPAKAPETGEKEVTTATQGEGQPAVEPKDTGTGETPTAVVNQATGQEPGATSAGEGAREAMRARREGLPEGFPRGFPVYNGTITSATRTESEGKANLTVTIETPDSLRDVMIFYEQGLVEHGYDAGANLMAGAVRYMKFTKGQTTGMITASNENGKTTIQLEFTIQQ